LNNVNISEITIQSYTYIKGTLNNITHSNPIASDRPDSDGCSGNQSHLTACGWHGWGCT